MSTRQKYFSRSCLLVLALTLVLTFVVLQRSFADKKKSMASMIDIARRISDKHKSTRFRAYQTIEQERDETVAELIRVLKTHKGDEKGEERCSTHLAVKLLASLGSVEAFPVLLDMIDYRVALRHGVKRKIGSKYPCARSLARIGGNRELLHSLGKRIRTDESSQRRRLMTWVVYRMLGVDLAQTWLKRQIQEATGEERIRLESAVEAVTKGNGLIIHME